MKEPSAGPSPSPAAGSGDGIDESAVEAFVETDRYCPDCGFNLITRPVFREPRTKLLLLRCAECGGLHPANYPSTYRAIWAQRLAVPILLFWLGFVTLALFLVGVFETGMHAVTLEGVTELSRHGRVANTDFEDYNWFIFWVYFGSIAAPLVELSALTVIAHHWRRMGYLAAAALLPIVPLAISIQIWRHDAPGLVEWGAPYLFAHYGAQVIGGLIGALFGRRIARLAISMLLPPRVRTMLAFVWLADGLPPPAAAHKRA